VIILIVEDERPAQRRLQRLVLAHPACEDADVRLADELASAEALLDALDIDLLLLDLDLHGTDGFSLLSHPAARRARVVVVSALEGRALEAFEYGVADFVPKPVGAQRLALAIGRALAARPGERTPALMVRTRAGAELVPTDDIVQLVGADDYVDVVLRSGRRLLHDESLSRLERLLPDGFLRVHRSHLVHCSAVRRVHAPDASVRELELVDGSRVPISRRRAADVLRALRRAGPR
jgi:two-component system, LytTR family, response regulator LytT